MLGTVGDCKKPRTAHLDAVIIISSSSSSITTTTTIIIIIIIVVVVVVVVVVVMKVSTAISGSPGSPSDRVIHIDLNKWPCHWLPC